MADLTIEVQGLDKLIRKLGRARSVETLRGPMERAVVELHEDMAVYPAPSRGKNPPRSEKQRRYLMVLARQGKIPYRRTGKLKASWSHKVAVFDEGLEGTVGSDDAVAPYNRYVESAKDQAQIHRGNWQTDEQVMARRRGAIEADFADAIEDALSG